MVRYGRNSSGSTPACAAAAAAPCQDLPPHSSGGRAATAVFTPRARMGGCGSVGERGSESAPGDSPWVIRTIGCRRSAIETWNTTKGGTWSTRVSPVGSMYSHEVVSPSLAAAAACAAARPKR